MPPDANADMLHFPDTPERRLRRALRQLDLSLASQREAMGELRLQLGALGDAVAELGSTADQFRNALDAAATEAWRARRTATELQGSAALLESVARP